MILSVILILIPAILATEYFLKEVRLFEKISMTIFFFLTLVPFVNINCVLLTGRYITGRMIMLNSIFLIVLFGFLILYSRKTNNCRIKFSKDISKDDFWVLATAGLIVLFAYNYYSNKEFILSLGSYVIQGDVECFFMQTFNSIKLLNINNLPTSDIYAINCTPGNTLFTSTPVSFLKFNSFKIVYILFTILLFFFVYLIVSKVIRQKIIAILTALFAVLNPYVLSVEVLDRNVMALAITAVLVYLLLNHKTKIFLHGFVFGILCGTGLRFLPLLFIIPVLLIYFQRRTNIFGYITFMSAFVITFTFNIPHLYFNGLNGLGETQSSFYLIVEQLAKRLRTPFLPYPNIIFYLMNIMNYFGYLISAVIMLGAFEMRKACKELFYVFLYMFLAVLFILSYQRNWIQGTKYRIIIEGFLPLYIFFAYGIRGIFAKTFFIKNYKLIPAYLLFPVIFAQLTSFVYFDQNDTFYKRKYIYQKETRSYYELEKNFLKTIGLLPNYKRLFGKFNIKKKKTEEEIMFKKLFLTDKLPNSAKFNDFYLDWKEYFLENKKKFKGWFHNNEYAYLAINFENLVTNASGTVKKIEHSDICAIDLAKEENLFDVYYSGLSVGWQKELLPVCVVIDKDEIKYLNELNIELNAFVGLGKDKAGFDLINSINFKRNKNLEKIGIQTAMDTFPLVTEKNTMVLKVPRDLNIIIRNWFINERGIPYKVDSWSIRSDKHGGYKAEFFYNEPESYL